jgi:two-component system sensor histidine kinase RpfC
MRDIERALASQDYGQWHDQLHMLKGGASDVGANRLARLCAEAERIKPYELVDTHAHRKLDEVKSALAEAQSALADYLDRSLRTESL